MFGKKGQSVSLGNLPQIALILVLIAMVTGAGALATQSFRDTTTTNSYAYNATQDGLNSLSNMSDQLPTIGTIIGVVAIIVVVVGGFAVFLSRRGGF